MSRATVRSSLSDKKVNAVGSTRNTVLNVAEQRFAEGGYDGTSLRDIQRAAKANSGAIFYYFGTKQALFEAVFDRLAEPLVAERLSLLSGCHEGPGRPDMLEQILSAYLTPALADGFERPESRRRFAQIRAQLVQAHHDFMTDLLERHFTQTGEKFLNALGHALPELSPSELQWRYHIMVGAVTFTMGGPWKLQLGRLAGQEDVYDPANTAEALVQMIKLAIAMFRAPARQD
jgi:AcrR family transcriptional regulator